MNTPRQRTTKTSRLEKDLDRLKDQLKRAKIISAQETELKNSCFFFLIAKGLFSEWHNWNNRNLTLRLTEEIKATLEKG